jgi:hypothetical protein
MTRVRAAFFVTVEAEVEDYAKFVAPHDPVPSAEQVQSWLSQNYFDRIDYGIETGDRPESLTWTNDTVVSIDEVADLVAHDWALADHIYGDDGFKEFVRQQEQARDDAREARLSEARIEYRREVRQAQHRDEARGYRDFL